MKLLILAACIFVVANGQLDKFRATIRQFLGECKEIVGASDVDIDHYLYQIAPDSDAGKCLTACVNKKAGIQEADGKISPDATKSVADILKGLDDKMYNTLINTNDKCLNGDFNTQDECEIGTRWYNCMSKSLLDAGVPLILVDK